MSALDLAFYQQRVDAVLKHYLPAEHTLPATLHQAMHYSVMNGGKRVRPILVYLTGITLDASLDDLDGPAAAVELIHAYSLIHDDLPAMDDDDLRRGKPTCHIAFDEATAILTGDALQTLAFEVIAKHGYQAVKRDNYQDMLITLAQASGSLGMGGGQAIDLAATGKSLTLAELTQMHAMKTGALLSACVRLGALTSPQVSTQHLHLLADYGSAIGLAFQIQDDILDIEADTETLGKPQGSDSALNKATFPALLGLEQAKQLAREEVDKALHALAKLPYNTQPLADFANYIITRGH